MTPEDDGLVRVFVDALSERFAGVGTTVTDPGAVRAQVSSEAPLLPPIDLPVVADENAGGVPVRRYQPAARLSERVVVYAHGGGWVIGDLDSHDRLCRRLARDLGSDVVAIGYRRAPEHRFPPLSTTSSPSCAGRSTGGVARRLVQGLLAPLLGQEPAHVRSAEAGRPRDHHGAHLISSFQAATT